MGVWDAGAVYHASADIVIVDDVLSAMGERRLEARSFHGLMCFESVLEVLFSCHVPPLFLWSRVLSSVGGLGSSHVLGGRVLQSRRCGVTSSRRACAGGWGARRACW
jgi:hypothetical protein